MNDLLLALNDKRMIPATMCLIASLFVGPLLPAQEKIVESPITDSDREHWAFQPIRRPSLPQVKQTTWLRSEVDAFILAKLEKKGLSPAPEADKATLLRRLSFDLIGLPPTPEELQTFVNDTSPDAYEREVDRLLASPAYGERWGQHWLDLARFAETDGFEHDKVRGEAWKYRDWVIAALNDDMPYDRFIREQLAGDELRSGGESIATMFCLAGPDMPDVNDQLERRHMVMNEVTSAVGSVLLGLQLGCAQCHDHKYDPLSQVDFYRLRAVFEPALPVFKREAPYNVLKHQPDVAPGRMWIRGDHRRPGPEVPPGYPRIAEGSEPTTPAKKASRSGLVDWLFREENPLTARVIANRVWQHHFGRGLSATPSDFGLLGVAPTHPELLDWLATELRRHDWSLKRLHRTILCSATYRQASRNVAAEDTWSQRLEIDPGNELYSRFPRRRLEGETLRDAMLAVSETISAKRGGPGVMPPLPEELVNTLLKGQWTTTKNESDHYRRSVYLFARRNLRYPIFDAFDRPSADSSCPSRNRSTTATQSLLLFNSEFSLLAARHLAGKILLEASEPSGRIERLYARTFSRSPTAEEAAVLQEFLTQQTMRLAEERRAADKLALPIGGSKNPDPHADAAFVDACLAMFNASEFLYVD